MTGIIQFLFGSWQSRITIALMFEFLRNFDDIKRIAKEKSFKNIRSWEL